MVLEWKFWDTVVVVSSTKCQRSPWRVNEWVEVHGILLPLEWETAPKMDEPLDGQWHSMEKAMGNHSFKDSNEYLKNQ